MCLVHILLKNITNKIKREKNIYVNRYHIKMLYILNTKHKMQNISYKE